MVTGLTNGIAYQFQIRARNVNGPGAAAETKPVTIATAPGRPRHLTAVLGNKQVELNWAASSNGGLPITSWQFRLIEGAGSFTATSPAWITIPDSDADTTDYTVSSLDNGTEYRFQLRAVNARGEGSHAQTAAVVPGMPPGAPTEVEAMASSTHTIDLTWIPPLDDNNALDDGDSKIIRYEYSQKADSGDYGEWVAIPASALFQTTSNLDRSLTQTQVDLTDTLETDDTGGMGLVIRDLTAGTAYQFKVRAVNVLGPGPDDESFPSIPGTPTANMLSADPGDGSVALSWNPLSSGGSAITKWQYRQSESGGGYGAWADIADSGPATTSHTVTGLSNGTSYTFQGRGVNGVGEGEAGTSNEASPVAAPPANGVFYAGVVTGPDFCANRSLGGPTTYPHDDDKDGVADVCALPYTRREAIARQLVGDVLAATHASDFRRELASACRRLIGADYGDEADDLARDACA